MQPGQRAGEIADRVADHAHAEGLVRVVVLIRAHDNAANLRREALVDVVDQALAAEHLQPLVHAAHAPALAAGKDQSGDCFAVCHVAILTVGGLQVRFGGDCGRTDFPPGSNIIAQTGRAAPRDRFLAGH